MNQGNNNVRQVSTEEIALAQGLTQEELQKTQVLNLKDVEEVARIEKICSKKPSIIIAIIGALLLTIGAGVQVVSSMKTEENKVEKRDTTPMKIEKTTLSCVKTTLNNPDGTDTVYTITYNFEDKQLVGYTKAYNVIPTVGNAQGPQTIENYKKNNQTSSEALEGYQSILSSNAEGITITTIVDFKKLDLTKVKNNEKAKPYTKVDYAKNTNYDKVKKDMLDQGFTVE